MSHEGSRLSRDESVPKGSISKHLASHNLSPEDHVRYIKRLLVDKEEQEGARKLELSDATRFVKLLDEALRAGGLDGKFRHPSIRYLARVCGWHTILPASMQISDYQRVSQYSRTVRSEGWTGTRGDQQITIKVLTVYGSDDERRKRELTRAFCKEVITRGYLDHPNILPFIGAMMVTEPGHEKYEFVSEFMENGEIGKFLEKNRGVNRLELLKDIAAGLSYLHSQAVIHGALQKSNVLISKHQRACLADFGLVQIVEEHTTADLNEPGISYMSPELLWPEKFGLTDTKPTKGSDIYALGILMYEVICGHRPYQGLNLWAAAVKFQKEEFPPRPDTGFTDSLWKTLEGCWQCRREMRPNADNVSGELDVASRA